ncbi:MAG: SAM-dependent chlorinase/fluorinase [Oscillospiraceae bacterium]|nr:SAM-dependent chlorinase/fluorinase [Oscillospiraceae bacterium]
MTGPSVVIHSDSGTSSTLYAKTAGIVETISPGTDAVDASQAFECGNVRQVSAFLFTSVPFWPKGTVFVSLVGEGEPIAVRLSSGSIILSPNNGTATMCIDSIGFSDAVLIDPDLFGNDEFVLVRCAAELAAGKPFSSIGKPAGRDATVVFSIPKAVIRNGYAEGEVSMLLKTFGNITFSIGTDEFEGTGIVTGDRVRVTFTYGGNTVYSEEMTYQPSFGYVPVGEPVVFNGSSGYMDIGLNMRSFIDICLPRILDVKDPGEFKVVIEKIGETK